jgi:SulP family sulfate permease
MTLDLSAYRRQWLTEGIAARRDILAGIVVVIALMPEAIGFSISAGVDPRVGLYASVAIAVSLIGGRPGMISAATAAVVPLVRDHDVD